MNNKNLTLEKLTAFCKTRGFVYSSSEIYGGLGAIYDYGHYGYLLKENIKKRNRSYEQSIEASYLFSLQEVYAEYIKQHNIKTLFIDVSNADFMGNEKHLEMVLDALEKDYENNQNYITLP